jgi:signal transduction histidine kinase/ActR/RegA family two-component response regulator
VSSARAHSLIVALYAPIGRDAALAAQMLSRAGIEPLPCATFEQLAGEIAAGIGAVLITEEELTAARVAKLTELLRTQPAWSDLPIVVFSSLPGELRLQVLERLAAVGNVSFVDRPVQRRTFLATVRGALRARARQYESRRAIEARDEFLAMLGHELRNPLSAVQFATDLIMRRSMTDAWVVKHADTIDRQTAHLNRLVDDLLDVSRVTSGKVVLRKEPTGLGPLVRRCVESLQTMADAHGLVLDMHPGADRIPVEGDVVRLEQVVINLVTNAIKYTPRGGRIDIEVSRQEADGESDGRALLVVRDTGVGIPSEHLESIFDVFSQAPTGLDRAKGGLGLGLTLVRALVGMHGGTVDARSDGIGKGSEFRVRLPLAASAGDVTGVLRAAVPVVHESVRIVLVEDNVDIRETLTELLVLDGYWVEGAADGPQGLTRILSEVPNVALIDVGLPGFDGYEVARRARSHLGDTPVLIAMTGYGQPDDRARAFEAGFDDHVVKPVSVEELSAAIERMRSKKIAGQGTASRGAAPKVAIGH